MAKSVSKDSISIATANTGFYAGFNRFVATGSMFLVGVLILWAGSFPTKAGEVLLTLQNWSTSAFGAWYVYVTAFYLTICLLSNKMSVSTPGQSISQTTRTISAAPRLYI